VSAARCAEVLRRRHRGPAIKRLTWPRGWSRVSTAAALKTRARDDGRRLGYGLSEANHSSLAPALERGPLSRTAAANASHTDMKTRLVITSLRW
jgi:hypothetical protein